MTGRTFGTVAALAAAVGESLGHSSWILVDQLRIDRFAEATGDHDWLHVDPVRAADGPYGGTIAHGFLTLSLVAPVVAEVVQVDEPSTRVNYGLERVRFLRGVPAGSRVRGHVTVAAAERTDQGTKVTLHVEVEVEDGGRPACVAEMITYYLGT